MISTALPIPKTESAPETTLRWDESPCPLCGHARYTPIIEAADANADSDGLRFCVVKCNQCELLYTNPRPDEASIGAFYSDSYRPHRRARQMRRPLRKWVPLTSLSGRPVLERRSIPLHGAGRLLDFGCGGGSFLERMAEQGWEVTGLDASLNTVQMIRDELGLKALEGTLPHPELEPESFDVVTMWHSLEHVHRPLDVLHEAKRLLVPGGRLLVAVPNIDSLPFRWFGESWFGLDLPRHLTHFTPITLRLMIERAGFQVREVRWIRHSDWLRSSAKLAVRQNSASFWRRSLCSKPLARLVAWGCYQLRQSDCIFALAER